MIYSKVSPHTSVEKPASNKEESLMLELEAIEMSSRIKLLKQELGHAFRHQQPCQAVRRL